MILFGNKIWAFSQIAPLPFEKSLRKTPKLWTNQGYSKSFMEFKAEFAPDISPNTQNFSKDSIHLFFLGIPHRVFVLVRTRKISSLDRNYLSRFQSSRGTSVPGWAGQTNFGMKGVGVPKWGINSEAGRNLKWGIFKKWWDIWFNLFLMGYLLFVVGWMMMIKFCLDACIFFGWYLF